MEQYVKIKNVQCIIGMVTIEQYSDKNIVFIGS